MPKKKRVKKDDKEQSQRFVETAKSLDADESGKTFEKALDSVVPKPKVSRSRPSGSPKTS